MKDYVNRKFYSKVGRASNSSNKASCPPTESHKIKEITMDFIRSELEKVRKEISKTKNRKKNHKGTSSFLTNTRENYMKPFVILTQIPTSNESPVPGKYSPNVNFIKPSPSPVLKIRGKSENAKKRLVSLPSCIDPSIFECSYPKKREKSVVEVDESEIGGFLDNKRFLKCYSVRGENLVLFEKQTKRMFLPEHSVADSRFEVMDYFPRISSKAKRSPVCDFSNRVGRNGSEGRMDRTDNKSLSFKKLK